MDTSLECVPCLFRQTLDAVRRHSDDADFHERVLREVAGWVHQTDLKQPPPLIAQRLHRFLCERTGIADPYAEDKRRDNALALRLLPELRERLARSDDAFRLALRMAIAGNQIDLGPKNAMTVEEVLNAVRSVEEQPFVGDVQAFQRHAERAERILYLADNAGEIVIDRLLVEALGPGKVTVVVRGQPVINDATLEDAEAAGLTEICTVVSNGDDVPGTILERCTSEVQSLFQTADLVISKGQGNYETLSENPREIYFLFKVKCPVIGDDIGHPVGTQVLWKRSAVCG